HAAGRSGGSPIGLFSGCHGRGFPRPYPGERLMAVRRTDLVNDDLELQEWLESIDSVLRTEGPDRAKQLFRAVRDYLTDAHVIVEDATLNTPYRNTIPLEQQPAYPGNIDVEQRIENINRWNAMAMVLRGYDSGTGVGGHIGTY